MTNHFHLVAMPDTAEEGLQRVLKPLHMRYAQRVNRLRGWKRHVRQGRFFSSPMDDSYLWVAIRYVERNPVRAQMVSKAKDYRWSSGAAHCGLTGDELASRRPAWQRHQQQILDWSSWLAEGDGTAGLGSTTTKDRKGSALRDGRVYSASREDCGQDIAISPDRAP